MTGFAGNIPTVDNFLDMIISFLVEDSGTSATFWVQNAANPTINTGQVTYDTSGLARFGDQDVMHFIDNAEPLQGGGYDDVNYRCSCGHEWWIDGIDS